MSRQETRARTVLFIQGAGTGAHAEDQALASSLRDALGDRYAVRYPKMPNEADPTYESWKAQLDSELASLDEPLILVGHSAGGHIALQYLSEQTVLQSIAGLFLIAIPYFGVGGWDADGWNTHELLQRTTFAAQITDAVPVFFYHSRDDSIVPFRHLAAYKAELPWASFREFDGREHQFANDLSEVARDIESL